MLESVRSVRIKIAKLTIHYRQTDTPVTNRFACMSRKTLKATVGVGSEGGRLPRRGFGGVTPEKI